MKKILYIGLVMTLCLSLFGCTQTVEGTEGMIARMQEELDAVSTRPVKLTVAGSEQEDDIKLIWFLLEDGADCAPAEFRCVRGDCYQFIRKIVPLEKAWQVWTIDWAGGYSILVNNPDCRTIVFEPQSGGIERVSVNELPFAYSNAEVPAALEFLDKNGEPILPGGWA